MLSTTDLEKLIAVKRRDIEKEKVLLGVALPPESIDTVKDAEENGSKRRVDFSENRVLNARDEAITEDKKEGDNKRALYELEEKIPPGLERYIRRYVGLPVMLKAGEFSPNNPLIRGERTSGDVLLGLGEYERRRNTLRKIRQQQYREYLDEQAKKKQETKEQADKERREREKKESEREEREKDRLQIERERFSPVRRASLNHVPMPSASSINKVDTGVQVNGMTKPLSVAVQTDDAELFRLSPSLSKGFLTEAERELSPRTVEGPPDRRRSYGHFDERASTMVSKSNRDKLVSDLRHTYMPSIFDADAIQLRNMQAEKDAAAKRRFYQQELKNQILEQQRIREERKCREKMLEQAEMRRLEEQLRMLRCAQDREVGRHRDITAAIKQNATDYDNKRTELQREIDMEQQKLLRATSQPTRIIKRNTLTSKSDTHPSKLPLYYPKIFEAETIPGAFDFEQGINSNAQKNIPYSINIPDSSVFSENYDVDSYLRRNLNFNLSNRYDMKNADNKQHFDIESIGDKSEKNINGNKLVVEKALVNTSNEKYIPSKIKETLPIPILRHSPKTQADANDNKELSDAMKVVDDKWKVPAVQKNVLKSAPNEEGKNVSILTQLGSIRRQLQLEQLKLDTLLSKDDV